MTPDEIAAGMDGVLREGQSLLPAPTVQNHAAFLAHLPDGSLACAWFGGSLEGKSDISIYAAILDDASQVWGPAARLSHLTDRSEQNPVIFHAPDGRLWLFNTAQPAGNQDESQVWMRELIRQGNTLSSRGETPTDLPPGTFIRGPVHIRDDGAWVLPLFLCNTQPGARWTGSFDTAAVGVSIDNGASWTVEHVPDSQGCVHMTPVDLGGGQMAALYRRRQSDYVHVSHSSDGGRTWSAPAPTDVPNNNSSICAASLPNGMIAMVCNPVSAATSDARRASLYDELGEGDDRPDASGGCKPIWGVERAPIALALSCDGGCSFPIRHVVENGPGTCLSNNSLDGKNEELSYPALLPREDGGLDIAYTYHRRAIKHVRLTGKELSEITNGARS